MSHTSGGTSDSKAIFQITFVLLLLLTAGWAVREILSPWIDRTSSGQTAFTLLNGDVVPVRYVLHYGHFVHAKSLAEPGLRARLSTMTIVGEIALLGHDTTTCEFEVAGGRFVRIDLGHDDPLHRSPIGGYLDFETSCKGMPEYRVAGELREFKERIRYRDMGRGQTAQGHLVEAYSPTRRTLWLRLTRFQAGNSWILLGNIYEGPL